MKPSAAIATIALVALLSGCRLDAPSVASGAVEVFESGRSVNTWPLDARNIEQLQGWLSRNNEGWNRDFVSYAPRIKVNLKSTEGSPFVLNLMDTTVIVYGAAGQFKKSFTQMEIASLRASLGIK